MLAISPIPCSVASRSSTDLLAHLGKSLARAAELNVFDLFSGEVEGVVVARADQRRGFFQKAGIQV
jgi:hypothetical protein